MPQHAPPKGRPVLMKHREHPPPELFCQMRGGDLCRHDVTVMIDDYDNISVYVPGNPNRLSDLQRRLISSLEKAAGWDKKPSNKRSTK